MSRPEMRQKYLLETAQKQGFVHIGEASRHLSVSLETIRRDIQKLCEENQLKKTRGGAVPAKAATRKDGDYLWRIRQNPQERMTIGARAASLIRDGQAVVFGDGVSVQAVASAVQGISNVTFFTNSLPIATILLNKIADKEVDGRVILLGGEIDPKERCAKGTAVSDTVDRHYFDMAFVACTALSADSVSGYTLDGSALARHMMSHAAVSVLVAEATKVGKNSLCTIAHPLNFDYIFTSEKAKLPEDLLLTLSSSQTKLVTVPFDGDAEE